MLDANGTTRSRSALIYGAALLVLAMLACAIYLAAQSWREARSDQSRQLATIAELGGIAVDTYLVQLEISMRNLGAELTEMQGKASRDKPDLDYAFKLVSRFQKLHSELGVVMLIRGDGQLLLTGNAPHSDDLPTLANDPTFLEFRAELLQAPAFAIGKPVMGYIDKSWAVAARYAVTDQSGKLLYILSANLPANLLQNYWTEATSPKISALGLIRNDGYLVSRYPVPDAASLNEPYAQPAADEMMAYLRANNHQQSGQVEMPGADGKPMLRLIRRLQHYPLTLFVEMPLSEVKAAGRGSMQLPYFMAALLLANIVAFYGWSHRSRRVWSEAERREALRKNYERALHERSPNEIFMFDADTLQCSYANDYALSKLGYSLAQLQQKSLLLLQPQLGVEKFGAMIEPLRRGERESVTYQTAQACADGSTYPVEVSLQLMKTEEGGEAFMVIANDISAMVLAAERIKA